jgi:hypothetical protein
MLESDDMRQYGITETTLIADSNWNGYPLSLVVHLDEYLRRCEVLYLLFGQLLIGLFLEVGNQRDRVLSIQRLFLVIFGSRTATALVFGIRLVSAPVDILRKRTLSLALH